MISKKIFIVLDDSKKKRYYLKSKIQNNMVITGNIPKDFVKNESFSEFESPSKIDSS